MQQDTVHIKDEEQSLEKYMDAFDMVILHDGTLEPVNAVLRKIFA